MNTLFLIILIIGLFLFILYFYDLCNYKEEKFESLKGDIPLIIHQTWKTKDVSLLNPNFKKGLESWKNLKNFEHKFYDDNDCLNFISTYYNQYLNFYNSLKKGVEKADIFRYLIIHKYGGVYADIDTICVKDITPLLDKPMIVGIEYLPQFNKGVTQYNQWCFGSVPNNPMFIEIIETIIERKKKLDFWGKNIILSMAGKPINDSEITFWLTGPYVFSTLIYKIPKESIHIYDRCILGSYDSSPECRNQGYIIHGFQGSWKNKWSEKKMKWKPN